MEQGEAGMTTTQIDDFATAGDLVAALAAREVSAVELADAAIARIERLDGPINAVVVRDFDRAREAAKAADQALARGDRAPLLGVPMTVKEAHNVAGLPTTWGAPMFKDWIAPADSIGVARLKAAGAVILGKTNVPPFLSDWQSNNPIYGRTCNPWDLGRSPGGSSGGSSAALAAGMVPLEFGSDIGGSIRIPSAFCGLYGHKPSHDLIPQRGHAPPGLDGAGIPLGVIGPMARCAADLDLALGVLAGPPPEEAAGYRLALAPARQTRLADYRVLMLTQHPLAPVDDEITAALDGLAAKLEAAGAKVARQSPLLPDLAATYGFYMTMLGALMAPPGATSGPGAIPVGAWLQAVHAQGATRRAWAGLFETVDVVIAPVLGVVAFQHDDSPDMQARTLTINGQPSPYFGQLAWPGMAVFANLPATAAPIGQTKAGLPIGAQIIGPYLEDRTTIGFAGLLEREFGGFKRPPGY